MYFYLQPPEVYTGDDMKHSVEDPSIVNARLSRKSFTHKDISSTTFSSIQTPNSSSILPQHGNRLLSISTCNSSVSVTSAYDR